MADREVIVADGGGSGVGVFVGIILGALVLLAVLYFTGAFGKLGGRDTKIDVDVNTPSQPAPRPQMVMPLGW